MYSIRFIPAANSFENPWHSGCFLLPIKHLPCLRLASLDAPLSRLSFSHSILHRVKEQKDFRIKTKNAHSTAKIGE